MEQVKAIDGRRGPHSAGRRAAAGLLRAWLAALSIAGLGTDGLAAESIGGLDSAFRPQGGVAAPAEGNGERTDANLVGVRVMASGVSHSVASIDGRIVRVGDVVHGMRVTQIDRQGVVLTREGGVTERLMVSPLVVKRMRPVAAARVSNGDLQ